MALNPADIAVVSRLLDQALALPIEERAAWLTELPFEHQRHRDTLRDMLAQAADLDKDARLSSLPKQALDESVAREGDLVGPYRLIREIGCGGMGSVWLVERADGAFKRQLALKLPRLAWGAGLAQRMARERDIGALLEHPNIARLYDAGVDGQGRPYLGLEYVDGQPIDAWCKAQGLDVRGRLALFVQVANAVAYAHGRLVVHRDLKPANVLVTPDGQAHLLDFGIAKLLDEAGDAKLTQQQGRVMTPRYASPEQVAGEPITVQSDVYSLGVLLYELLTGSLPIEPKRNSPGALEEAILQGDAPLASSRVKERSTARMLRGEVDAILSKAMQVVPARRYATADMLVQDIERYLCGEAVSARPYNASYRLRKSIRRHWIGLSASTAVLVAILTGSAVAVVQARRASMAMERQQLVTEFVADMFRPKDGTVGELHQAAELSPQALLDRGAQLITSRFAGQPELQAELYGVVGGVFSDMGAYRLAGDYSMLRVALLSVVRSEASERSRALLAVGQAMLDEQRIADAEPQARKAMELARGNEVLELDATILLARIQIARGQLDGADALLKRADQMATAIGAKPTTARAWIAASKGRLLMIRNRLDDSIPVMERAIDIARLSEGPRSMTAVSIGLTLANQLGQTIHGELAQRHFIQSTAVLRSLGGPHRIRAALASARFAWRLYAGGGNGTLSQAVASLESSRQELNDSKVPKPNWFVPLVDFWLGSVKAGAGDVGAGLRVVELASGLLSEVNDVPIERFLIAGPAGDILMFAGRHELADNWYREELQSLQQLGGSRHPYAATVYHHIAENLLMNGQFDEAEATLDGAPRFESVRGYGSDTDRYNRLLVETRAQVLLARGNVDGALALIEHEPPRLEVPSGDDGFDRTLTVLGETLCAAGRSKQGIAVLQHWLARFEALEHDVNAPWIARLRAVTGHCAFADGDRRTAIRESRLARAAFTAQPGVSPYYKAPLLKLERALGLKLPPV
jgi:serine/threonine protein kinase